VTDNVISICDSSSEDDSDDLFHCKKVKRKYSNKSCIPLNKKIKISNLLINNPINKIKDFKSELFKRLNSFTTQPNFMQSFEELNNNYKIGLGKENIEFKNKKAMTPTQTFKPPRKILSSLFKPTFNLGNF